MSKKIPDTAMAISGSGVQTTGVQLFVFVVERENLHIFDC